MLLLLGAHLALPELEHVRIGSGGIVPKVRGLLLLVVVSSIDNHKIGYVVWVGGCWSLPTV